MTVLISGAGIAGLSLGLSLHQVGIPFHIFEAVNEIRSLGVGINLQPHATRELFELGLKNALDKVGLRTEEVGYYSKQGSEIWREPRGMLAGYNWPQYSIHRGDLQMALYNALVERAGNVITMGAAVSGWKETDSGVQITLSDRQTGAETGIAKGRILVAADGINSTIRAGLYPNEGPAVWGGTMMWRGITQGPRFLTGRSMMMAGSKGCKFVAYPIGDTDNGGSLINWIADLALPADYDWLKQDWNRTGNRADFAHHFTNWDFDWFNVPQIIAAADGIWEFPMVDRNPLPQWSFGPVTLLGDAAHAMYPIGSNGASQGIIDARILARILLDHGVSQSALGTYDSNRRETVNAVVLANRGDGPDKILDIVAERAPNGFNDIETVMPLDERQGFADTYKKIAGMDIKGLNVRASLIEV